MPRLIRLGDKSEEFSDVEPWKVQEAATAETIMAIAPKMGEVIPVAADPYPKNWRSFGVARLGHHRPEETGDLCPACVAAMQGARARRKAEASGRTGSLRAIEPAERGR
jgi:hypothetical protein